MAGRGQEPWRAAPPLAVAAEGGLALESPTPERLAALVPGPAHLALHALRAGYGKMEVLHGIDLRLGRGQSLCIIGPNGSGKSTVLNALFGLADVLGGRIEIAGRDVIGLSAAAMLVEAKVGYVLQASSVFPDMTVEENLLMGGHLLKSRRDGTLAVERILDTYPRLAERRSEAAGALSGGERRLLELSRALITDPEILLVDEPSIGLEPRTVDLVFAMLERLQRVEGRTVVMVEQNARKGLEFADLGYVLVAGHLVLADRAARVRENPEVGRLFLGG
jgi:branched-chain amino acid transport system ATP-binding protein